MSAPSLTNLPTTAATAPGEGKDVQRYPMTYDEYLAYGWETTIAEWKEGEVIITISAKEEHQRVVGLLFTLISLFTGLRQLGLVYFAPFEVRLQPDGPSREPDVFFVATAHLNRLSRGRLTGAPDLAIEIVSDDSVGRDRGDKFDEYQDAGVPEYWIIDPRPRRQRLEAYALDAEGRYQLLPIDQDGILASRVLPGFWIQQDWLWTQSSATAMPLLAEILGLPGNVLDSFKP